MVEPGCGELLALELLDRQDALALAAEVDEDGLAADADHFAGPEARTAFLAALVGRIGHALGPRPALRRRVEALGVEALSVASSSASSSASHCRLRETSACAVRRRCVPSPWRGRRRSPRPCPSERVGSGRGLGAVGRFWGVGLSFDSAMASLPDDRCKRGFGPTGLGPRGPGSPQPSVSRRIGQAARSACGLLHTPRDGAVAPGGGLWYPQPIERIRCRGTVKGWESRKNHAERNRRLKRIIRVGIRCNRRSVLEGGVATTSMRRTSCSSPGVYLDAVYLAGYACRVCFEGA